MTTSLLVDGSIVAAYFVGITAMGLYLGRREHTLSDFALGGRNIPWWAVMASIIAAETSAATFLGTPGEGYKAQSVAYAQLIIGLILGRIFVGFVFLDRYFQLRVYTVYDYLAVRFGSWSKNYVAGLFLVMRTLASGTRLFVPSLVMVLSWQALTRGATTDFNVAAPSLTAYAIAIAAITFVTCFYTTLGGIKAVIWTDLAQATLMFGGAAISIVTLLYHIGHESWNLFDGLHQLVTLVPQMKNHRGYFILGWESERVEAWKTVRHIQMMTPLEYVRLFLGSEYTLFSAFIGSTFANIAAFGTDQDMVQRMLTAQSAKKSRRSLITASFIDVPIAVGFALIGVLLVAYYKLHPAFKPAANADIFASYILNVLPIGIRGFVLAGIFATAMGSLSAALNALATSATNDWYLPYFNRSKTPTNQVLVARVFTIVFALLMIGVAFIFAYVKVKEPNVRIIPVVLGIAGLFLGPMSGVFLTGMLTRTRGSDAGNMIAITVGIAGILIFSGQYFALENIVAGGNHQLPEWVPVVTWPWFTAIGACITFAGAILFKTPIAQLETLRSAQATGGDPMPAGAY